MIGQINSRASLFWGEKIGPQTGYRRWDFVYCIDYNMQYVCKAWTFRFRDIILYILAGREVSVHFFYKYIFKI